jgi:hypothetical protein
VVFELGQPGLQAVALGDDLGQGLPVLPAQLPQQVPALAHELELLRVLVDRLAAGPQLGRQVDDLGRQGAEALLGGAERPATGHGGDRHAQGAGGRGHAVGGGVVLGAAQGDDRGGGRLAVGGGVGERVLARLELAILVGAGDGGGGDLVDLVAHQVELAGPGPLVAPHARQLVEQVVDRDARRPQRGEVDAGEAVERVALGGGVQQRLVRVLTVQVDEQRPELGQLGGGRQPAVDVGPAAARARDRPRHDHFVGRVSRLVGARAPHETPLDPRLVRPGPHQHRVGPAADQQLDGVDHHRLARAGLARHHGHPPAEQQAQLGDHTEIADGQLYQHGPLPSS